ncbi:MAG: site-2 protease family protein, partial [Anaerolineae bacterium]|nr:site-2 protease family protein [Anaerolineae bacterium]
FIFWGILLIFRGYWINGLWMAFIGWFLENAAGQSYRQVALRDRLAGHTAREAMMVDCPRVPPDLTLEELVHDY